MGTVYVVEYGCGCQSTVIIGSDLGPFNVTIDAIQPLEQWCEDCLVDVKIALIDVLCCWDYFIFEATKLTPAYMETAKRIENFLTGQIENEQNKKQMAGQTVHLSMEAYKRSIEQTRVYSDTQSRK